MKLNAPKVVTWWIAVVLAVLGFLGTLTTIPIATAYAFWFVLVAAVLLLLATALKGL